MRLVWEDEQNSGTRVQRRTIVPEQQPSHSPLTVNEINSALDEIDSARTGTNGALATISGPFSVFTASLFNSSNHAPHLPEQVGHFDTSNTAGSVEASPSEEGLIGRQQDVFEPAASVTSSSGCASPGIEENQEDTIEGRCTRDADRLDLEAFSSPISMVSIKQKVQPQVTGYVTTSSPEERSLLHYWITELSTMMIPTPRYDNPFRTIFIPLALEGWNMARKSSGNLALLHAIYAVSAFNQARIPSSPGHLEDLGTKHHEISLRHLWTALSHDRDEVDFSHTEAILATIITMSSIEVMIGSSAIWRTHLAGGRSWLNSIIASNTSQSASFWTLCQIFLCIDTLGNPDTSLEAPVSRLDEPETEQGSLMTAILDKQYCLERLFGITKPILEAIVRIKMLSTSSCTATEEEVNDLRLHIRLNDPDAHVSLLDESEDSLIRHNTSAFFCATLIYFERRLLHTPAKKLQRLVRRSLDHFDAIRALELERGYKVCGLFWPEFITACEAEDVAGLRERSLRMFDKGRSKGIGNIISAEKVVFDVWRRRDTNTTDDDISWETSMSNLGLDIILT